MFLQHVSAVKNHLQLVFYIKFKSVEFQRDSSANFESHFIIKK